MADGQQLAGAGVCKAGRQVGENGGCRTAAACGLHSWQTVAGVIWSTTMPVHVQHVPAQQTSPPERHHVLHKLLIGLQAQLPRSLADGCLEARVALCTERRPCRRACCAMSKPEEDRTDILSQVNKGALLGSGRPAGTAFPPGAAGRRPERCRPAGHRTRPGPGPGSWAG